MARILKILKNHLFISVFKSFKAHTSNTNKNPVHISKFFLIQPIALIQFRARTNMAYEIFSVRSRYNYIKPI